MNTRKTFHFIRAIAVLILGVTVAVWKSVFGFLRDFALLYSKLNRLEEKRKDESNLLGGEGSYYLVDEDDPTRIPSNGPTTYTSYS